MHQLQKVLDLSIVFTQPPPDSSPEILAHIAVQCEVLGLNHTGEVFADPLTKAEKDDLRWYLEEYWQWPYLEFVERGKRVEALLGDVGRRFYHTLFGSREAQNIVQAWQQYMNVQHRISIVSEIASILRLPWELLADSQGFLVLRADHPISMVRRLPTQGEQASLPTPFQFPLRVLLVTARPEGAGFVDPRSISRELVDELQRQSEAGTIELEFLRPPTFAALSARLKNTNRPIHVLHFDGHGGLGGKKQQGVLLFEDKVGKPSAVEASDLAKILKNSGVRLAVLTACQSAMGTREDDAFSSVSTQLINNGVDAVIAMSSRILVISAALYAEAFYHALAKGLPVSIAQEQARQALHKDPHRHLFRRRQNEEAAPVTLADWWVPHFYQQRPLVLHATTAPRKHAQQQTSAPARFNDAMPPEPRYRFSGRAWELHQIERHLLHKRLVVLSGFGGVGKTALAREAADWLTRTGMYTSACFVSFEHGGDASMLLGRLGTFLDINDGNYSTMNPEAALAQLQSALSARPTLLIADNLESRLLPTGDAPLEHAARSELWHVLRELATLSAGVLLTSRDPLAGENQLTPGPHVASLPLGGLTFYDAYALATHLLEDLNINRARAPYTELRDLLAQLDHHPLAIQLVLPTLREQTLNTIRADFSALLPTFKDDRIEGRNRSLLASLGYSLRRLSQEQRALLPRLAIFEGGANEGNLLAITQIPEETWTILRLTLEQTALLVAEQFHKASSVPFLRFHPLLIPYLRQHAKGQEDEVLHQRYVHYYVNQINYLAGLNHKYPELACALVRYELPNLYATLACLLQAGDLDAASRMTNSLTTFLTNLGLIRERDRLRQRVDQTLTTAFASGRLTEFTYLHEIGRAGNERSNGKIQEAFARTIELLARIQALPSGTEVGPGSFAHCRTLQELGLCLQEAGQYQAAQKQFQVALALLDVLLTQEPELYGLRIHHANLLGDLGQVLREQGLYTQAQIYFEQSLQESRAIRHLGNEAVTLQHLGTLALEQRDFIQARLYFQQALKLFQYMDDPERQASTWHQLGTLAEEQQAWTEAERCFRESLALNERIGMNSASTAHTCNNLAFIACQTGRPAEAEGWFKRALEGIKSVEPDGMVHAICLSNLAALLINEVQAGRAEWTRLAEARSYLEQSRSIKEQPDITGDIWNTYNLLAQVAELEGQSEAVRDYRKRERESYVAFPGNRLQVDQQYGDLINYVVASIRGDAFGQAVIAQVLPALEQKGWHISEAVQRIRRGEHDWQVLTEGLGGKEALLLLRVLETLAALPDAAENDEPE